MLVVVCAASSAADAAALTHTMLDVSNDILDDALLDDYPVDKRTCRLLGPTALVRSVVDLLVPPVLRAHQEAPQVVQALMGILVVSSLLYKRYRERPRRPWRIWFAILTYYLSVFQ